MRAELMPFFDHRATMSEAEAATLVATLIAEPSLVVWMKEQLEIDDLISRVLVAERADFVNRVHAVTQRVESDRFVARVRRLAVERATASARLNRPAPSPLIVRAAWAAMAAAALVLSVGGWWWGHGNAGSQVLQGRIEVGRESVRAIPDGAGFTVAGDAPALIRLKGGSQAQLAPASEANIPASDRRSAPQQVMELTSGSGEFSIAKDQSPVRVETDVATVTGQDGQFTAELRPRAMKTDGKHDAPPKPPMDLAVTVKTGTAHVEFKGHRHDISADETRVFKSDDERPGSAGERELRGPIRSLNLTGSTWTIAIGERTVKSYALNAATRVLLNDVVVPPSELRLGDRVDARFAADVPGLIVQIAARRAAARRVEVETHAAGK